MSDAVICIIVLLVMLVLYASNRVPLAIVSTGACIFLILMGIMEPAKAWANFSSDTEMLIAGMMIMGLALFETGVAEMVGDFAVKLAGGKPKLAMLSLFIAAMIASAFLNNTTTTVTLMPVLAGIVVSSKGLLHEKNTLMPLAIAACMGGNFTLIGSTPQVIFHDVFVKQGIDTFGFFEYAKIALPLAVIFVIYYVLLGDKVGKAVFGETREHSEAMEQMVAQDISNNSKNKGEKNKLHQILSIGFFVCTVIWMIFTDKKVLPMGTIAMIGAFLCMATNCISFKTTMKKLDWSTLIFFATALSFAAAFTKAGAGQLIADSVIKICGESSSPFLIFAVMITVTSLLTQLMSNTALAAMMAPIVMSIASSIGVSPYPFAMGIIIGSSISISTPVATSPMTLIVGMGGYKFMDYVKYGGLLNLMLLVGTIVLVPILWPF